MELQLGLDFLAVARAVQLRDAGLGRVQLLASTEERAGFAAAH